MMSYYTVLIVICLMSLGILCILVHENSWIPAEDKRRLYLTYGIIAASAFSEWCGMQLNGNAHCPGWLLSLVKCFDYALTPMAGDTIVAQMKLRNRWERLLFAVLAANAVFQIVAAFNGWVIVVDAGNRYAHGPLYPVYVAVCLAVIALTTVEFLLYGRAYRRQNRGSLYSVLLLVVFGVGIQEIFGGEFRTAYLALTMGVALMFIHYAEFYQMTADEHIRQQRRQLMRDALSGVYSRHAYMTALEQCSDETWLPDDFAAFTIDINGLKTVNDTLGHEAGDELIVGAARCIEKVIGEAGKCYRTGGDEFVVLARMAGEQVKAVLEDLKRETRLWSGKMSTELSLSTGCALAAEHAGMNAEHLVREADQAMYAEKAAYYKTTGRDRRRPR